MRVLQTAQRHSSQLGHWLLIVMMLQRRAEVIRQAMAVSYWGREGHVVSMHLLKVVWQNILTRVMSRTRAWRCRVLHFSPRTRWLQQINVVLPVLGLILVSVSRHHRRGLNVMQLPVRIIKRFEGLVRRIISIFGRMHFS